MVDVATALAAGSAPALCGALPARGGCYGISVAGGGVCREARDGACGWHAEEMTDRKKEPMRVRGGSTGCTASGSSIDHCASGKCDVTIGDKTYCSQCATGYVPIDGTCTQVGDATSGKCLKAGGQPLTDDTQCGQCGAGYFLHKSGCYAQGLLFHRRKPPHARVNCAKSSIRSFGCRWILAEEGYLGG